MKRKATVILLATLCVGAMASAVLGVADISRVGLSASNSAAAILGVLFVFTATQVYKWDSDRRIELKKLRDDTQFALVERDRERTVVNALANGLDVAILVCDGRANILYANRRAKDLFKFESFDGRTVVQLTLSYELERLVQGIAAGKDGESQIEELTFSYPSEIVGRCKAWISPTLPDRVYASVYDITDLRRLERVRRDFVANVSHELRTPLTLIRTMAETLQDEDEGPARRANYLNKIVNEVDRLSSISHDLLELSTAESNPVRKQACDLAEVVRSVIEKLHEKASDRALELTVEGPPDLTIAANPLQMTQVAYNLIDNALNYTFTGSVKVHLGLEGDHAVLSVQDTGIGIASDHIARIFERFYRADKARSRSTGGTGLGLSIVKHIVESHGGTVKVDSTLNMGSTFTVTLPVA